MTSPSSVQSGSNDHAVLAVFQEAARQVDGSGRLGSGRLVIGRETQISDLGLDSVAVMELVAQVEQRLDIRIPDEQLMAATSIGALVDVVERLLA